MLHGINRSNRLFMVGNFLFALSYGLWMNLRQLHLGDLGASPAEVGTALGIIAIAGGLLPIPAGLLTDRIGPKRVILGAWGIAAIGTLVAALATTWPAASLGFAVFMLVIAANPATVAFVLLNVRDQPKTGEAERVMATVFASWPAAMIFAPALGGLIADWLGIQADLWIGVLGFAAAVAVFALTEDVRPAKTAERLDVRALLANRRFIILAAGYALALVAVYVGYALAPTYLQAARGLPTGAIGALFSVLSAGSLAFNYVVGKARPQTSLIVLIGAIWLGTLLIWQFEAIGLLAIAFALLGAVSSFWLLAQAAFGQTVNPEQRGLALGITESLAYGAIALASWLAGQLYERTPAHDLPLVAGLAALLVLAGLWVILRAGRHPRALETETSVARTP